MPGVSPSDWLRLCESNDIPFLDLTADLYRRFDCDEHDRQSI